MSGDPPAPEWPGSDARPQRRGAGSAVELDDNLALYDDLGQMLILLNSSAAAVWDLCDGTRTLSEIVDTLAGSHPAEAHVIPDDVRQTVRKLAELGLVGEAGVAA